MNAVMFEVRDRVGYATLNRPEAMNGIDEAVLSGLASVAERAGADESVKALVIAGAGEAFCVGLDIGLLKRAFDDPAYFRDVLERYKQVLLSIEAVPVPVVAAVGGLARAGGFELLLACDLAVVAEEARVGDHHLAFGIPPGGGSTQRLPRIVGEPRAREIIFTGRWVPGPELVAIGLAARCVPRARLGDAVEELVSVFRARSRGALAATKAAMRRGADLPLRQGLDAETEEFMRYLSEDPHAREGFRAWVEKRDPKWP